ncbi:transposase [Lactococcus lactis]|nr:Tn3 family transposase [Lactococcus lactis]MDG4967086.1 transposase [Lactococcus lactis]
MESHTIPNNFKEYLSSRIGVLEERLNVYQKLGKSFNGLTITKKEKNTPDEANQNLVNKEGLEVLFSTLMAMGLNIRFQDMEKSTHITSAQMANAEQWRMSPASFKRAQSVLINKQITCPFSEFWGDGSKASSDGLRMQLGVSSIHSDFNPHYGNKKGQLSTVILQINIFRIMLK